jgi:hypothetical protein
MAELKLTGIRVVEEGAGQVKAELLSVGDAGDKVEASFRATARAATESAQQMNVSARAAQQMGVSLDQLAAAANGDAAAMRALAAATNQVTVAATQASGAFTRMSAPGVSGFRQLEQEVVSIVRMSAPAVSGFRQLADAQETVKVSSGRLNEEIGHTSGLSHSAVIGLGELARGVGRVAESGELGAFAMREFSGSAMRLGGALGPAGGLAGIVVLLGGVIIETFTKARKEMEDTRKKFEEEIAKMANAGQLTQLQQKMRDLLYGQPFDEKNQLRTASKYAQGAFAGSLADLEAHFAQLQQQLPNGATMAPAKIADEWNKVVKALDAARTQFAALRTAALNVGNQPSDMDGLLPMVTTAQVNNADEYRSKLVELNAALPALKAGLDAMQPSLMAVNNLWVDQQHNVRVLKDDYPSIIKDIQDISAANEKAAKEKVNQAAEQIKKEIKYQQDLQDIWRSSIGKIATDGLKSFQDFFEDVNQLFTRLLARMEKEGKANGIAGKLLGFGAAAVGGAAIGYASQSPGIGAVGGALAGSAYGPYGALIGGLAGLTGGLLGGAQAAKQRRDAEEQLRQSLQASARDIQHQIGAISDLDAAIAQAEAQRAAAIKADLEAYGDFRSKFTGKNDGSATSAIDATNKLFDDYIAWLKKQDEATKAATKAAEEAAAAQQALADAQKNLSAQGNYQLRFLNATGQGDAAFKLQQQLEMDQAIADGLDAISIRLLTQTQAAEAAQREQQKQTQLLQDQLSTAQQNYDALKGVVDNLTAFKSSLAIGQYSPLSPRQQLDAARGQLNTLYQAALGGDQGAAGQFSGAAQSFLDASRKYNASGAGYVLDYNSVNVMTDKLTAEFGRQMTDAQKQVSLLQQQLDVLKSIDTNTILIAQRPLTPTVPTPVPVGGSGPRLDPTAAASAVISAEGFSAVVAAIEENTAAVNTNTTITKQRLDSLTTATTNRRVG